MDNLGRSIVDIIAGGGGTNRLDQLQDTAISSPYNGSVIVYHTSDQKWHSEPRAPSYGTFTNNVATGTEFNFTYSVSSSVSPGPTPAATVTQASYVKTCPLGVAGQPTVQLSVAGNILTPTLAAGLQWWDFIIDGTSFTAQPNAVLTPVTQPTGGGGTYMPGGMYSTMTYGTDWDVPTLTNAVLVISGTNIDCRIFCPTTAGSGSPVRIYFGFTIVYNSLPDTQLSF